MSAFYCGRFKITGIKPAPYHEVFSAKTITTTNGIRQNCNLLRSTKKPKRKKGRTLIILCKPPVCREPVKHIDAVMGNTMITYDIASVTETLIMDVYEHMATMGKTVANDKPEYEEDPISTKEAE